jgi:hypothetical protein
MSEKAGQKRDPFTFSLGGLTTVASFFPAPAVPDDQFRQSLTRRGRRAPQERTAARCQPEGEPANAV